MKKQLTIFFHYSPSEILADIWINVFGNFWNALADTKDYKELLLVWLSGEIVSKPVPKLW